jgi:hypothetical protein
VTQATDAELPPLEFWPDYGPGPLWQRGGTPADPAALGLPADLVERLRAFNDAYEEERLPVEGGGDPDYLTTGVRLLADVRDALDGRFRVVVTEPWWGEPASEYER